METRLNPQNDIFWKFFNFSKNLPEVWTVSVPRICLRLVWIVGPKWSLTSLKHPSEGWIKFVSKIIKCHYIQLGTTSFGDVFKTNLILYWIVLVNQWIWCACKHLNNHTCHTNPFNFHINNNIVFYRLTTHYHLNPLDLNQNLLFN